MSHCEWLCFEYVVYFHIVERPEFEVKTLQKLAFPNSILS